MIPLFLFILALSYNPSFSALAGKTVCIIGAGPCGLFLAKVLLQQDPTVRIHVVERNPREGPPDSKAFGFGIGGRLKRCFEAVPGLSHRVEEMSVPLANQGDLRICGRSTLCEVMLSLIEEQHSDRFRIDFEAEACLFDLDSRRLHVSTAETREEVSYDLLVGADGINSDVRRWLVQMELGGLHEDHFLHRSRWKALKLPQQPGLGKEAFRPLCHPSVGGSLLPRYPEGHTVLMFWRGGDNPPGIQTVHDLRQLVSSAIHQKNVPRTNMIKSLIWKDSKSDAKRKDANPVFEDDIIFDEDEVARCLNSMAGREHFMKINQYHFRDSVVLLGDAAHGMYSMLGQGCACGFESTLMLAKCLSERDSLRSSLRAYSCLAVPEGHAASDLNLLSHVMIGKGLAQMLATPLLFVQALKGKLLYRRVNDPVSYQEVLEENRVAVSLARWVWKRQRLPFEHRSWI